MYLNPDGIIRIPQIVRSSILETKQLLLYFYNSQIACFTSIVLRD